MPWKVVPGCIRSDAAWAPRAWRINSAPQTTSTPRSRWLTCPPRTAASIARIREVGREGEPRLEIEVEPELSRNAVVVEHPLRRRDVAGDGRPARGREEQVGLEVPGHSVGIVLDGGRQGHEAVVCLRAHVADRRQHPLR